MRLRTLLTLLVCLCCVVSFAAKQKEPFSSVPAEQHDALAKRLEAYVQENRTHDWDKLYDLISSSAPWGSERYSDFSAANQTPDLHESHLAECANDFKMRCVSGGCYHRIAMDTSDLSGVPVHGRHAKRVRFRQAEFDLDFPG